MISERWVFITLSKQGSANINTDEIKRERERNKRGIARERESNERMIKITKKCPQFLMLEYKTHV